jgi:hypothetical protein
MDHDGPEKRVADLEYQLSGQRGTDPPPAQPPQSRVVLWCAISNVARRPFADASGASYFEPHPQGAETNCSKHD